MWFRLTEGVHVVVTGRLDYRFGEGLLGGRSDDDFVVGDFNDLRSIDEEASVVEALNESPFDVKLLNHEAARFNRKVFDFAEFVLAFVYDRHADEIKVDVI